MELLSATLARVKPSPTIAVTTKAAELKAAGRDIIQRTEDGTYAKDRKNGASFQMMKPKAVEDAETLLQTYNSVINDLNVSQC